MNAPKWKSADPFAPPPRQTGSGTRRRVDPIDVQRFRVKPERIPCDRHSLMRLLSLEVRVFADGSAVAVIDGEPLLWYANLRALLDEQGITRSALEPVL